MEYKDWIIYKRHDIKKYYAYNYKKDEYINPIFSTVKHLIKFINNNYKL